MGMTDRQFDSYQRKHVRNLKKVLEKFDEFEKTKNVLSIEQARLELGDIVNEIEDELKRP